MTPPNQKIAECLNARENFFMTRDERKEILEDIARNSTNAAARIAAVKELAAMEEGERVADADLEDLIARK